MNKTTAAMVQADFGANALRPDTDNMGITQYHNRPGAVYLSPSELINWSGGPWGPPYWAYGWALKTTQLFYAEAPSPWQKSALLQAQNTPLYTAGQAPFGSAPTNGVYTGATGVHEDGCS